MEPCTKVLLAVFIAVTSLVSTKTATATAVKSYCPQEGIKGYFYTDDVRFFCCNGTQIADKLRFISKTEIMDFYHPCQTEISTEVETEKATLADYLWKLEACVFRKKIGFSAEAITYEKYVETQTTNFTTENDIKSTLINNNKDCPEAAKETLLFHKKFKAMKNCFSSNLEQECTSKEVLNRTITDWTKFKKEISSSCPHIPGVKNQLYFCCKTESLPLMMETPLSMQIIIPKSPDQSLSCLNRLKEISKTEKLRLPGRCSAACLINPVIFEKGSSAPAIDWKAKATLEFMLGFFNISSVKMELLQIAEKRLSKAKVSVTQEHVAAKTGYTFAEMETAYTTKPLNESIFTYCLYYMGIKVLAEASVYEHCHGSTLADKYLNKVSIF